MLHIEHIARDLDVLDRTADRVGDARVGHGFLVGEFERFAVGTRGAFAGRGTGRGGATAGTWKLVDDGAGGSALDASRASATTVSFAIAARRHLDRPGDRAADRGGVPGRTIGLPGSVSSAAAIVRHVCTPAAFCSALASLVVAARMMLMRSRTRSGLWLRICRTWRSCYVDEVASHGGSSLRR